MVTGSINSVDRFIELLGIPESIIRVASVLLINIGDCHLFYADFYHRNRYIIDDLLDFREHKISISKTTVETFVEQCYKDGIKIAFESTFYQSFTDSEISMIENAIITGKVSYYQLYADFNKNPNKNILKNVI